MEDSTEITTGTKQRHGCVTAWLILMIVMNSLSAILYLFAGDMMARTIPGITTSTLIILAVLGIANVIFSALLFQWNKWGFWGFIFTSIGALVINLSIGIGFGRSLFGLAGIAILYGILQIKQNDVAAWDNLEQLNITSTDCTFLLG
jgi:hypothetical protein